MIPIIRMPFRLNIISHNSDRVLYFFHKENTFFLMDIRVENDKQNSKEKK